MKDLTVAEIKTKLMQGLQVQGIVNNYDEYMEAVDDEWFRHKLTNAFQAFERFEEALNDIDTFMMKCGEYGFHMASKEFDKFLDCGGFSLSFLKDQYLVEMEELEDYILQAE